MLKNKELLSGLLVFFALFSLVSCRVQYITVEHTKYVTVRDSVYFKDTTVQFRVEKEYVRDYTALLDTLELSTTYADARAWLDTAKSVLAGEIENKKKMVDVPVQTKGKIVYKDSLVYKDVPVPVEVIKTVHPKYEWGLWAWDIASLLVFVLFAYCFLKKKSLTL